MVARSWCGVVVVVVDDECGDKNLKQDGRVE